MVVVTIASQFAFYLIKQKQQRNAATKLRRSGDNTSQFQIARRARAFRKGCVDCFYLSNLQEVVFLISIFFLLKIRKISCLVQPMNLDHSGLGDMSISYGLVDSSDIFMGEWNGGILGPHGVSFLLSFLDLSVSSRRSK
jgi:hypothetical protein